MLTSPPYGLATHGHVRSSRDSGQPGVRKWNHHYTDRADRANLAYQRLPALLDGFSRILAGSIRSLRPGGLVAVTARPYRHHGELIEGRSSPSTAGRD
ncbi:hypothetical protein [Spongiactinospora sp. 9N601]|uniref:hypothetical protein n=1 Tax=Spongiactinospora sp. 9N601 TaxID=3375149 RepID=UPI00378C090C